MVLNLGGGIYRRMHTHTHTHTHVRTQPHNHRLQDLRVGIPGVGIAVAPLAAPLSTASVRVGLVTSRHVFAPGVAEQCEFDAPNVRKGDHLNIRIHRDSDGARTGGGWGD